MTATDNLTSYFSMFLNCNLDPRQKAWFEWQLEQNKQIERVPFNTTGLELTEDFLKFAVRPNQCFANAARIAQELPDVNYVEGYLMFENFLQIDHAWNEYNGMHFDLTAERCFKQIDPTNTYHSIITLDTYKAWNYIMDNGQFGGLIKEVYQKEILNLK